METRLSGNRGSCVDHLRKRLDEAVPQGAEEVHGKVLSVAADAAKRRFGQIKVQNGGFDALEAGLHATYRKGRRALAQAEMEPDDEVFHELRKSVQQHWRQMLLVSRAWPDVCRARASASRDIAQILGEEHDHAVLAAFADSHRGNGLAAEEIDIIDQDCRARQMELRSLALPMARRLFAERPGRFAHQMAVSWQARTRLARLLGAGKAGRKDPTRRHRAAAHGQGLTQSRLCASAAAPLPPGALEREGEQHGPDPVGGHEPCLPNSPRERSDHHGRDEARKRQGLVAFRQARQHRDGAQAHGEQQGRADGAELVPGLQEGVVGMPARAQRV